MYTGGRAGEGGERNVQGQLPQCHCVAKKGGCQREGDIRGDGGGEGAGKGKKWAGPATMTSRAKGDEVAGIDKCDKCGRDEGNVLGFMTGHPCVPGLVS